MVTSQAGIDFIKKNEGFRATAYNDSAGNATIGYGTLLHHGPVTELDAQLKITEEKAAERLTEHLTNIVEPAINRTVKAPLRQNEFDAIADWVYNLGTAYLKEEDCTWLRELNSGHYGQASIALLMWNKAMKNGILTVEEGLTRRRVAEAHLFNKAEVQDGSIPGNTRDA